MKEFSTYEKKILTELIMIDEIAGGVLVLGNILEFELNPNFYLDLESATNCPIKILKTYLDDITNEFGVIGISELVKELTNKFLTIIELFQYLESEKLISFSCNYPTTSLGSEFDVEEERVSFQIENEELNKLIYKYSRKIIKPTDALTDHVQKNFETNTVIQATNSSKSSGKLKTFWRIIVGLSVVVGLIVGLILIKEKYDSQKVPIKRINKLIFEFLKANESNDPKAIIDFLDFPLEQYISLSNVSSDSVRYDREKYISVWPKRSYVLQNNATILNTTKNETSTLFTLTYSFLFEVENSQKINTGGKFCRLVVKYEDNLCKIKSITEYNSNPNNTKSIMKTKK